MASGRARDGVVEAVRQATLTAQTTGRVTAVNADVKDRVAGVLLDWTEQSGIDEAQLTIDIDGFVDRYHGVPLGQLDLAGMLLEVTALLRSHQLALPADLALLIKVCLTLEGLGRSLDPDFEMARQAQPFLRRAMAAQLGPRAVARRGARAWTDAVGLMAALPRELRRLLRGMRGDGPRVHMEIDELKEFGRQVAHSANRLAGSMVIAALIVGSSITMTVKCGVGAPCPQLGGEFFAFDIEHVEQCEARALLCQHRRARATDTQRGAGDDAGLVLQAVHDSAP